MMQTIIFLLYIAGMMAAIVAGIPQLRKLVATKRSDEFSISAWFIWLFAQVTALLYATSIKSLALAIVSGLWLGFYVMMVTLILKYRVSSRRAEAEAVFAE